MVTKKLKGWISLFTILLIFSENAIGQVRIVMDPGCIAQVNENILGQTLTESSHNKELDSLLSTKKKTLDYAATMATISEVYQYAMQNIKGFGVESNYYTEIGLCSYEIITRIPRVIRTISHSKVHQQALCIAELSGIYLKTEKLVEDFVNIVNNSKVENPLKKGNSETKNDGYNLLDRYDRLAVANRIYTDLLHIRYKLEALEIMAQYATWNDLVFRLDPDSWAAVMTGANKTNYLINQWKGLYIPL